MDVWRYASAALLPGKRRGIHCIGGWGRGEARARLDGCRKSRPRWDSIAGPSSPSLHRLSYPDPQMWNGVADIYSSCSEVGGALSFFPVRYVVMVDDFGKTSNFFSYQIQSWCITLFLSALELWLCLYAYRRFELRIFILHLVWRMEYCLTLWLPSVYTEFRKYTCYDLYSNAI